MIKITVKERGPTPRGMRTAVNQVLKESWELTGIYWHRMLRPKHFTPSGAAEYQYRSRSRRYTYRKQRRFHHRNPLQYTGTGKALTRPRDVRATRKGVRIVMRANVFNFRPRGLNMRDELTRISLVEKQDIERRMERDLERRFKRIPHRETRRVV